MIDHNLCKAMGLDMKAVQSRLRLLELSAKDKELIDRLHRFVIDPHLDLIIDEFYEFLMAHAEFRAFIHDASMLGKLTRTFRVYLSTLGIEFDSLDYFNDRLRVGIAHQRISMPLMLYECAYRKLQALLLKRIPAELNEDVVKGLGLIIHKLVTLDMTLAVDSYNLENVKDLKGEIKNLFDKEEQMKRYASIDPLTRIRNRGAILDRLRKIVGDKSSQGQYCLIMIDVDNLREVNDKFGHLVGDYMLKRIVEKINSKTTKTDIFGRYGGDEFMIILKDKDIEAATSLAEEIRDVVNNETYAVGEDSIKITISQGISLLNNEVKVVDNIRQVDMAMIKAKNEEPGKIVVAGSV